MPQKAAQTVNQFKGLNRVKSVTALPPNYALDLLNCIIPKSGGVEKMRSPLQILNTITTPVALDNGPIHTLFPYAFNTGPRTRGLVAGFGPSLVDYELNYARDGGPTQAQYLKSDALTYMANDPTLLPLWSYASINFATYMVNGQHALKYYYDAVANQLFLRKWGHSIGSTPALGAVTAGSLSMVVGRRYRVSNKSSVTGHVSKASPPSTRTAPFSSGSQFVSTIPVADLDGGLIDTYVWYATEDGGSDYFFHSETTSTSISDTLPDASLDKTRRAPLLNDPPPSTAKYVATFQGRAFLAGMGEAPLDIIYSGLERIFEGRPEETFPGGNRMRLTSGDAIKAIGVAHFGVVAWTRGDEMYMFRGQPEDITLDAPVQFSAYLEQLPWSLGCFSHSTVQVTDQGLAWLGTDMNVRLFNGAQAPFTISDGVEPLLRRITPGQGDRCRSAYYSYGERNWYVLAVPIDGAVQPNRLILIDLDPDEDTNGGIFVSDIGVDSLAVAYDTSGTRHLFMGRSGFVYEMRVGAESEGGIGKAQEAVTLPGTPPVPPAGPGPTVFTPTTTLDAISGNNTSASSSYDGTAYGNARAGNVSNVSIKTLTEPYVIANRTFAHYQPWFGQSNHIDVGYSSNNTAQVHKQVDDAVRRGLDGFIINWYYSTAAQVAAGAPSFAVEDGCTDKVKTECEGRADFLFCLCPDWATVKNLADPVQGFVDQMIYANRYFLSPKYFKIGGRPVVVLFGHEQVASLAHNQLGSWSYIRGQLAGLSGGAPLFIRQNTAGFTNTLADDTDGAFDWVDNSSGDLGKSYIDDFMNVSLSWRATRKCVIVAYKGFNNTIPSWGGATIMPQGLGQTWRMCHGEYPHYYSNASPPTSQADVMQLVTWNDYEEGTELETGIDNGLTVGSISISGSVLNFAPTGSGQENTIHHYEVYAELVGGTAGALARLGGDLASGTRSYNLSAAALSPGTYLIRVRAVGIPFVLNRTSAAVQYTQVDTSAPPPPPPAAGATIMTEGIEAFYRSGYFGEESQMALFRYARVVTDRGGFRGGAYIVDDSSSYRNPRYVDFNRIGQKMTVGRKARRVSFELRFPVEDAPSSILSLSCVTIPVAVR